MLKYKTAAKRSRTNRAFTLIELMVVVVIVGMLLSLTVVGAQKVLAQAQKAEEMSAARNLILAYQSTAVENDGYYLPGFDQSISYLEMDDGDVVSGPAAERYPFRLAPYLNYQMEGTILLKENSQDIDTDDHYAVSLHPAFGMNSVFVGGHVDSGGEVAYHSDCITTSARAAVSPLVFATAASSEGEVSGYFRLNPPNVSSSMWSGAEWSRDADPANYGYLDARHGGKVIAAFLDGSVRQLTVEELRDMTLWSLRAAEKQDSDYSVTASSAGTSGSGRM